MISKLLDGFCRRSRYDDVATPIAKQEFHCFALFLFIFDEDDE